MPQAFFVAGTDTDIGKTTVAAGLLHAARSRGLTTAAAKPVASGCRQTRAGLRNGDAQALQRECHPPLPYELINPYAFEPAIAPHVAACEAGVALGVAELRCSVRRVLQREADFTLVEGAGGWRVPLSDEAYLSDLAVALGLPVILVVGVRLGCLNHALLTAQAIQADGLQLARWVGNQIDPHMPRLNENLRELRLRLSAPCLGFVPRLASPDAANVAVHLSWEALSGG